MEFQPFYSFKHSFERQKQPRVLARGAPRRRSARTIRGTEVFLTLVDLDFRPSLPPTDVIAVQVTCTNRDLPGDAAVRRSRRRLRRSRARRRSSASTA